MEEQAIAKDLLDKKMLLADIVLTHNLLKVAHFQANAMNDVHKSMLFLGGLYNTTKAEVVSHPDAEKDADIKALIDADKAAAAPPVVPEVVQ